MGTYNLKHRYRSEVVVPYVGIQSNVAFLGDEDPYVITADGIRCKVVKCEYKNIFEIENKIRTDYNMDILSFLRRWYETDNDMQSLEMMIMTLQKCNPKKM